jgi:hypothetical protein
MVPPAAPCSVFRSAEDHSFSIFLAFPSGLMSQLRSSSAFACTAEREALGRHWISNIETTNVKKRKLHICRAVASAVVRRNQRIGKS